MGPSLTVLRSTFEEALIQYFNTSPDTSILGNQETGDRGTGDNHRLGTWVRGGTMIGPRVDLIHADLPIVIMFWGWSAI